MQATPPLTLEEIEQLEKRSYRPDLDECVRLLAMARRSLELEEQVKPFADIPTHGKHGGPLVRIDAVYEDGSMQHLSHEKHEKLRAALTGDSHAD